MQNFPKSHNSFSFTLNYMIIQQFDILIRFLHQLGYHRHVFIKFQTFEKRRIHHLLTC